MNYKLIILLLAGSVGLIEMSDSQQWKEAVNGNSEALKSLYLENGYSYIDGQLVSGSEDIGKRYNELRTSWKKVGKVESDFEKMDMVSDNARYEIGGFTTSGQGRFSHLVIWSRDGDRFVREWELIFKTNKSQSMTDELKQRRIDWVNMSNKHDVPAFLKDLYVDGSLYYWNGQNKLYQGDEINSAYSYMSGTSWKIESLTSYHVRQVSKTIIFEVGKYSGNGGTGDYALVWKKTDSGWQILYDSNY